MHGFLIVTVSSMHGFLTVCKIPRKFLSVNPFGKFSRDFFEKKISAKIF
jgi:hypothetical protein